MTQSLNSDLQTPIWAIGLMSGTSLDGIDAAMVRTDGERVQEFGARFTLPYTDAFRARVHAVIVEIAALPPSSRPCAGISGIHTKLGEGPGPHAGQSLMPEIPAQGRDDVIKTLERDLTLLHAEAVRQLLAISGIKPSDIGVIGFHGQTLYHNPANGITWQIGDGALLARETGIDVVNDFRSHDVEHGGQGAPLVPLFHAALCVDMEKPVAVLNIGGSANITWVGERELLAFDTGPGNALINDWVSAHTGKAYDQNGAAALSGKVDNVAVQQFLQLPYFNKKPPKSLDRQEFSGFAAQLTCGYEDGAAILTECTAAAVQKGFQWLNAAPQQILVCGGGRHNPAIMQALKRQTKADIQPVEVAGWDGDALEAQAFGFLAVRSLRGLPLSVPGTTGVREPVTGGVLYSPAPPAPLCGATL